MRDDRSGVNSKEAMMDMAQEVQQDRVTTDPGLPSPTHVAQEVPQTTKPDERVFRQTEVNELVGRARREGAESAAKRTQQQDYTSPQQPHHEADIRRLAAEEAQRLRDTWVSEAQNKAESAAAEKIVQNFYSKINPGKEKYEDFEKVTGNIEYSRFPNVVQLLSEYVDNSHDVLYELGKDQLKMWQIESMARDNPQGAIREAQRLAQSIKDNDAAGKIRTPNEPLSQMRPSNVGTDTGVMTVSDYRKKYKI